MNKKKLITAALALLCALLVLAGCQEDSGEDAAEYVRIAENKATEFKVVSYLSDNEPVKEFMLDLLIKTGAAYSLSDETGAGGSAIYIGTAEQLGGKGGAAAELAYTRYEISADGGNIYVCLGEELIAEDILEIVKNSVVELGDGVYGIGLQTAISGDICNISEVVPMFHTETGEFLGTHDCGAGNYQATYQSLSQAGAGKEIAAYEAELLNSGYTLHGENEIGENRFATYVKGDTMVHCNYFAAMGEFRIVYGPKSYLPEAAPVTGYEAAATPSVSIIGMTDNVLCMVVQLADGSFVVIDGGWDKDALMSKTLNPGEENERVIDYIRDAEADMESLYRFLQDNTPGGGKPQVTWMITHADPDHILLPTRFVKDYAGKFDLRTVVYNFPNFFNIGLGESGGSTNDPVVMTAYAEGFLNAVNTNFPEANHYLYHTGQRMYLPGCEIEFLFTAGEDYWPNKMPWMNHTSGAWRFTIEGKTILITGDIEKGLCGQMADVFGGYLKSDVLQVVHHGANGATLDFYRHVDPVVCFWPCQQYHLDYDSRQAGVRPGYEFNEFLRTSKEVTGHYSNSETHTVLLPSLEEK